MDPNLKKKAKFLFTTGREIHRGKNRHPETPVIAAEHKMNPSRVSDSTSLCSALNPNLTQMERIGTFKLAIYSGSCGTDFADHI